MRRLFEQTVALIRLTFGNEERASFEENHRRALVRISGGHLVKSGVDTLGGIASPKRLAARMGKI